MSELTVCSFTSNNPHFDNTIFPDSGILLVFVWQKIALHARLAYHVLFVISMLVKLIWLKMMEKGTWKSDFNDKIIVLPHYYYLRSLTRSPSPSNIAYRNTIASEVAFWWKGIISHQKGNKRICLCSQTNIDCWNTIILFWHFGWNEIVTHQRIRIRIPFIWRARWENVCSVQPSAALLIFFVVWASVASRSEGWLCW